MDERLKRQLRKDPVNQLLEEWMEDLPNNPFKKLPEDERLYLVMHIKGSKLRETGAEFKMSMTDDLDALKKHNAKIT